jgi:hypothetical protein
VVDEVDRLVDIDVLGDVGVSELEPLVADVRDVLQRTGLEVVQAEDPVPRRDQGLAEVGTEKAGTAGHYTSRHGGRCYRLGADGPVRTDVGAGRRASPAHEGAARRPDRLASVEIARTSGRNALLRGEKTTPPTLGRQSLVQANKPDRGDRT